MLMITVTATFLIGAFGVYSISQSVKREAQARVTHDLGVTSVYFQNHLEALAQSIEEKATGITMTDRAIMQKINTLKQELDLHVLNLCDVNGRGVAGTYSDFESLVPIVHDPAQTGLFLWVACPLFDENTRVQSNLDMTRFPYERHDTHLLSDTL
jgi:hypothetical protein